MEIHATTSVAVSGGAPRVSSTLRWTVPLAVVALGFLIAVTFRAHPAPGLHGQRLAVTAALVVFACALLAFERVASVNGLLRVGILAVMVVCAGTLVGLQPDGPGFLFLLPPVAAASFRLGRRSAAAVAALSIVALALAASLGAPRTIDAVIVEELAVAAYFGIATFAGLFILADKHSQFMIDQLEKTRVAQAEAAALQERQRLAREMHDVLAHSLSGLVLNLEGARVMVERGATGPKLEDAVTRAHSLAKTGLQEAQRAIGLLRDDALPGPEEIERLANDFQVDTGVPCRFIMEGAQRELDSDLRLALYRVAQEALTNIRKHASPDRVEVCLTYEPKHVRLVVQDFQAAEHPPPPGGGTGYGLNGMRERAELLGGALCAAPSNDGFRVELSAPR